MQRHTVASSSLRSVGYDPSHQLLEVEFATGRVYRYEDVPQEAYDELLAADSLGRHFNARVRDRYPTEEVTPARSSRRRR
ncbi:KTSC domain-containing protein [Caldimonas brevitalea]|nr:KTSC domain-containing protein [Caldimonas brevitalea]